MEELDATALWKRVLETLQNEALLPKPRVSRDTINTVLHLVKPVDAVRDDRGSMLLLEAANDFAHNWLSSTYGRLFEEKLASLTNGPWSIQWTVAPDPAAVPTPTAPANTRRPSPGSATATAPLTAPRKPQAAAPRSSRVPGQPPSATATAPLTAVVQPRSATATAPLTTSVVPPGPAAPSAFGAISAGLRPAYSFENFVVGPSNQLAHAAAMRCADPIGKRFNPLFLCGPSGLGKTHLLNAIGHKVLEHNPNAGVAYLSAERFTNEFIQALQTRTMDEFRTRYRTRCDALLLDDVQFLAGKEQTLDEFFHTFNALIERNAPIVLTSDVLPQNLQGMPDRLLSRFASGMVAEVYAPELETRVAILRKKAELENIRLDDEGAFALAQAVATNMRELEGELIKMAFKATVTGRTGIDGAMVRETLRIPTRTAVTTVEDIQKATCEFYRIKLSQLVGKERTADIALARQVAMFLCRERLGTSYPQLGAKFGGKDHTTVMAAVQKIKKLVDEGASVREDLGAIEAKLTASAPTR